MHFLLLASILAAVSFGQAADQAASEYSECPTLNDIVTGCKEHLADMTEATSFENVADLDDPTHLLGLELKSICNHSMHLKMYYTCVYTNLTTCLKEANSTQVDNLPDTSRIAMGVVTMCQDYTEVNKSCVDSQKGAYDACVTEAEKGQASVKTCSVFGDLFDCTDELDMCKGAEVIQAFLDSARPHHCEPVSAASQSVTAVAMLLVTLTFSLLITL